MSASGVLDLLMPVVYAMLSAALVLAFVRLVIGPSLPDRVVALDLIAIINVGFIAVYAIDTDQSVLLDAAIVMGLITFLGTTAFALYIERRTRSE